MMNNSFGRFLRDERGSYTIWSLVWFILYVAIGGLAVDATDAYRHKSLLQSTADAAALAGVMSVGVPGQDPVAQATTYAANNLEPDSSGIVLDPDDVTVGTWNFATEVFSSGGENPNAVHVVTRRSVDNGNPVAMNFLRILGVVVGWTPLWNVATDAVAVKGVDKCRNNGHIAYTTLEYRPGTYFHNGMCLIGHEGFFIAGGGGNNAPEFDHGVYIGVGCESGCVAPGDGLWQNETFLDAFDSTGDPSTGNYSDYTMPSNAMKTGDYITAARVMAETYGNYNTFTENYGEVGVDYSGFAYLTHPDTGTVNYVQVPSDDYPTLPDPEDMQAYTLYDVDCNGRFEVPTGTYANVGMIFDCDLSLDGDFDMTDVMLATTSTTGQCFGDCNNPQGAYAVQAQGPMNLGSNCTDGVEFYSLGGMHFAASGNVTGSRILAQGNIFYAAQAQGNAGIHMETTGGIFQAAGGSESHWGLCDGALTNGPKVLSYALVR